MFGFIKNLIAGIFGFIGGLFGKKDEYYLELKEEAGDTAPAAAKPAPAPTTKPEPATVTKAEPAKVTKTEPAKASKPEPVKVSKSEPAKAPAAPTETTFAPKYLIPTSSGGRRRPGANMNSFLDMARQVKVPG